MGSYPEEEKAAKAVYDKAIAEAQAIYDKVKAEAKAVYYEAKAHYNSFLCYVREDMHQYEYDAALVVHKKVMKQAKLVYNIEMKAAHENFVKLFNAARALYEKKLKYLR